MSMILDALSRAEKERQAENASAIDAGRYVPSSTIKDDRFKKWVLIALVANFVLIALLVSGFVWKSYSKSESNNSASAAVEKPAPVPEIKQSVQIEEPVINEEDVFADAKSLSINTNKTLPATSLIEETKVNVSKENKRATEKSCQKNCCQKSSCKIFKSATKAAS